MYLKLFQLCPSQAIVSFIYLVCLFLYKQSYFEHFPSFHFPYQSVSFDPHLQRLCNSAITVIETLIISIDIFESINRMGEQVK